MPAKPPEINGLLTRCAYTAAPKGSSSLPLSHNGYQQVVNTELRSRLVGPDASSGRARPSIAAHRGLDRSALVAPHLCSPHPARDVPIIDLNLDLTWNFSLPPGGPPCWPLC